MAIKDGLLPELDHEMANTRKTLERVPDDKLGWQPHDKSMTFARLAGHLANLPQWAEMTLLQDSVDINPPGGSPPQEMPKSRQEILDKFDANVAKARAALSDASGEQMMKPWSLLSAGNVVMTMPKVAVLRSFVMNHNVHHRAQLGVYLRLNDIPVPSIYGPSADEGTM